MKSIDLLKVKAIEIGYDQENIQNRHVQEEIKNLAAMIEPEEDIIMMLLSAEYNNDVWAIILTNTRILLACHVLKCKMEVISLRNISSVTYQPGNVFIDSKIILQESGSTKCLKTSVSPFKTDFAKIFADKLRDLLYKGSPIQNTPICSVADELLKLKELLDAGLLTRDEFEKEKNKILMKNAN